MAPIERDCFPVNFSEFIGKQSRKSFGQALGCTVLAQTPLHLLFSNLDFISMYLKLLFYMKGKRMGSLLSCREKEWYGNFKYSYLDV